jgi:ABC-type uncharacterized transport system substrate-binding protein
MAARVMRGDSLATFPYGGISKTGLMVNQKGAAAAGLQIPEAVIRRAEPQGEEASH